MGFLLLLFGGLLIFLLYSSDTKPKRTRQRCKLHQWRPHDAKGWVEDGDEERLKNSRLICKVCYGIPLQETDKIEL